MKAIFSKESIVSLNLKSFMSVIPLSLYWFHLHAIKAQCNCDFGILISNTTEHIILQLTNWKHVHYFYSHYIHTTKNENMSIVCLIFLCWGDHNYIITTTSLEAIGGMYEHLTICGKLNSSFDLVSLKLQNPGVRHWVARLSLVDWLE